MRPRNHDLMAWEMLCKRLQLDPLTAEQSDTCTLRAAWKAMLAFEAETRPYDAAAHADYHAGAA